MTVRNLDAVESVAGLVSSDERKSESSQNSSQPSRASGTPRPKGNNGATRPKINPADVPLATTQPESESSEMAGEAASALTNSNAYSNPNGQTVERERDAEVASANVGVASSASTASTQRTADESSSRSNPSQRSDRDSSSNRSSESSSERSSSGRERSDRERSSRSRSSSRGSSSRDEENESSFLEWAKIAVGGMIAFPLAYLAMMWGAGLDPFGVATSVQKFVPALVPSSLRTAEDSESEAIDTEEDDSEDFDDDDSLPLPTLDPDDVRG